MWRIRAAYRQATIASAALCRPLLKDRICRDVCQLVVEKSAGVLPLG